MEFSLVCDGYCFLEAPRTQGENLWFTDLLLGGVYRRRPDGTNGPSGRRRVAASSIRWTRVAVVAARLQQIRHVAANSKKSNSIRDVQALGERFE